MELQLYSLSLTSIFLIIFFSLFCWLVKLSRSAARKIGHQKLPPGPWKLPIIGNLHNLVGSLPHHALRELARQHGPFMHLQLGQISALIVSSPTLAKEIFKTHDLSFSQRPQLLASEIVTYGGSDIAFSPYGEYWRQMRKVCIVELLSTKRVQSLSAIREDEVWNLIESIRSSAGLIINFTEKISSSTCTIISRTAFGNKCKDLDAFISLAKESTSLAGGFDSVDLFPSSKFLQVTSPVRAKLEKIHIKIDQILENIIHDHKHKHDQVIAKDGEARDEDLVDALLRLQQSGTLEFPITMDNIKAVILDVFTGGTDNSSAIVEWAMTEMMKNPRVMKKAQSEARKFYQLQGNKRLIHEKYIEKLSYLKWVIKETIRLHPSAPLLLPRECREACKINGYEVPVKTKVIVNAWAIGRDPEYWDDAESFVPERFDGSSVDYKGTNFEFIPFGAGRRMCPAIAFGVANVELPLANLLYHFNWELPSGLKPENVDMTEAFGATVRRQSNLYLIATPFNQNN